VNQQIKRHLTVCCYWRSIGAYVQRAYNMTDERRPMLPRNAVGRSEDRQQEILDSLDVVSEVVAEFFAVFFVVFIALGAVYASAIVTVDVVKTDRNLYMALAHGFAYAGALYTFSYPKSDTRHYPNVRHINPALTLLLTIFGKFGVAKLILYWIAQTAAAGLAVMAVYYCTPFSTKDVTTIYPLLEDVSLMNQWFMNTIASFIVLLAILMTSFHHWRQSKQPSVLSPLAENSPFTNHELNCVMAGAVVFVCALIAAPICGGYMNPLFAIGIGILSDQYPLGAFICPFIGAFLAFVVAFPFGYTVEPAAEKRH